MKKSIFKKMAVAALSLTLFTPMAITAEIKESTISVDYSMTKQVSPDTASIKFYVENSGTNIADIKEKNDKIVNETIKKIKAELKDGESVKTVAYRINSIYSYKDKIRVFQKYEVTNGFEVKLKDLGKISKIIKIATDSGVKRVDQLNFTLENVQEECNKLLAETSQGAYKKAGHVASALHLMLDKPKSINPYCSVNSNYSMPRYYNSAKMMTAGAAMDSAEGAPETIEAGEITLRANVNMTYYLK